MHVRRALLLFAIVLALAALVASIATPTNRDEPESADPTTPSTTPTVSPGPTGGEPKVVRFEVPGPAKKKSLPAGTAGTVSVKTDTPGEVQIPGLGLTANAELHTPASIPVLVEKVGSYEILFTPAGTQEDRPVGTLKIES